MSARLFKVWCSTNSHVMDLRQYSVFGQPQGYGG
jgi:hypothetical protein